MPFNVSLARHVLAYRAMAYVTGVVLIVLCIFTVLQFFAHVSAVVNEIGVVHGTLYIIYLLVCWPLARRLGLKNGPTIALLLAGTVPVMTFIVENRIRHRYLNPALAAEAGTAATAGTTASPAAPVAREPR